MRIAFFSDNFFPELSGIADSIIVLGRELVRRGHAVSFYVPHYSLREYKKASIPFQELYLEKGVKVRRLFSIPVPTSNRQGRLVIPNGLRWISLKEWQPDLIHSQLFFGVGLEGLIAAKVLRKPIIGTNHTAITEFIRGGSSVANWLKTLSLRYAVWYYNHCRVVTAPSQSVIDEMKFYGLRKPHEIISNPIDIEMFTPEDLNRNQMKKSFGISASTVTYAGRLAAEKNIDMILQAIAIAKQSIPRINLALAGQGTAAKCLRNLAQKLHIEESVKFLGPLSKPQLARLFHASEVFVITSTSETQSMTLMQAMAAGLPVVGVRARALPEYIHPDNGFLVEASDYHTLAEKIMLLLQKDDLRIKLGKGGRQYVQQFSASRIAQKWEVLYEKVLKEHSSFPRT